MPGVRHRLQLSEYGTPIDVPAQISALTGLDRRAAQTAFLSAGDRIMRFLGHKTSPFFAENGGFRVSNVAGMIRLGPSIELEIAPKFLPQADTAHGDWREDFYYLANLSRHGRLLSSEKLGASSHSTQSMVNLVARSLITMYRDNRLRPLRSYRRANESSYFADGDIDPIELRFPGPDGFVQTITRYDQRNRFNALISTAVRELLPEVSDPLIGAELTRIQGELPLQPPVQGLRNKRLPSRAASWAPLVDLSDDIVQGLGVSLRSGFYSAPGYVVSTWQVWEDFLRIAIRLGFGRSNIDEQKPHALGRRIRSETAATTTLFAYPDLVVRAEGEKFVVDAKYKASLQDKAWRITEADIYESLAFAKASGSSLVILLYPKSDLDETTAPGSVSSFEEVVVEETVIYAAHVQVRGVASGGLKKFSETLKSSLLSHFGRHRGARAATPPPIRA